MSRRSLLRVAPAVLPVSRATLKLQLRLEDDDGSEDDLLDQMIGAATELVEGQTGIALIEQGWSDWFNRWPAEGLVLGRGPLVAVEAVLLYDDSGGATSVAGSAYLTQGGAMPRLVALRTPPRPGRRYGGIEVRYTSGFGTSPAAVPDSLAQAVLQIAAALYERRGDGAADAALIPLSARALIAPWKRGRL